MSMMHDRFCGNCGSARSPQDTTCPQCGVPFEAPDAALTASTGPLQAPTQVASTPPQSFWQPSSPTYHAGVPPLPALSSRWTTRLLIGQGVIVVALLAVILIVLLHPFASGDGSQSRALALNTATVAPTLPPTPTLAPTPTYVSGLSSSDPNVFARSLGEALQAYDVTSIEPYVLTKQFFVICLEGNDYQGTCDTSWAQVRQQIAAQQLLLDILTQGLILVNATSLDQYCTGLGGGSSSDILAIGSFEQETSMPLSHLGGVVLGIASSGGSALHPTYAWSELYFC